MILGWLFGGAQGSWALGLWHSHLSFRLGPSWGPPRQGGLWEMDLPWCSPVRGNSAWWGRPWLSHCSSPPSCHASFRGLSAVVASGVTKGFGAAFVLREGWVSCGGLPLVASGSPRPRENKAGDRDRRTITSHDPRFQFMMETWAPLRMNTGLLLPRLSQGTPAAVPRAPTEPGPLTTSWVSVFISPPDGETESHSGLAERALDKWAVQGLSPSFPSNSAHEKGHI